MKAILEKPVWISILFSFFFIAFLRVVMNHCSSYYDLGIYSDALRSIHWDQLNPFIPGRNIHIFNDHFDPILIPFSFLTPLISAPLLGMMIEFIVILCCWFPLRLLRDRATIGNSTAVFAFAFIILNHAMTDAIQTPFHPTTWACLPLLYVFAFYLLKDFKKMMVALLFLFSCREEFPLMGISLGAVMLFEKNWRWGSIVSGLSLLWTLFVFALRPHYFEGTFSSYGSTLLHQFLSHPFAPLKEHFKLGMIRMFLARMAPLLLVLRWQEIRKHLYHALKILIIASPILGIRYASAQWAFHYGTAAIVIVAIAFLPAIQASLEKVQTWRKHASLALISIIFLSPAVKNGWDGFFSEGIYHFGHDRCPLDSTRLAEIEKAQKWIAISGKIRILMENNLVATQMIASQNSPEQQFYIVGGLQKVDSYDVLLVEKPPSGDPWPSDELGIQSTIETWRTNPNVHIITDNSYLFLAQQSKYL